MIRKRLKTLLSSEREKFPPTSIRRISNFYPFKSPKKRKKRIMKFSRSYLEERIFKIFTRRKKEREM